MISDLKGAWNDLPGWLVVPLYDLPGSWMIFIRDTAEMTGGTVTRDMGTGSGDPSSMKICQVEQKWPFQKMQ
jgi:hypothetical protein